MLKNFFYFIVHFHPFVILCRFLYKYGNMHWICQILMTERIQLLISVCILLLIERSWNFYISYFMSFKWYCFTAASFTPIYYKVWACKSGLSSFCPKCIWSNAKDEGFGRCEYLASCIYVCIYYTCNPIITSSIRVLKWVIISRLIISNGQDKKSSIVNVHQ